MKIAVVCIENEVGMSFANSLADYMQLQYLNFQDLMVEDFVESYDFPLEYMNVQMQMIEKQQIKKMNFLGNCVVFIENETFLSNGNHQLLNGFKTICLEIKTDDTTKINIQKLIKKYCKISINQENINLFNIKNIILEKLK